MLRQQLQQIYNDLKFPHAAQHVDAIMWQNPFPQHLLNELKQFARTHTYDLHDQ